LSTKLSILVTFVLLGFFSVPPCSGAEVTILPGVLRVQTLVQVEFNTRTNDVYTLYTSGQLGGAWEIHPSCNHATFPEGFVYKLWDNPDNVYRFFKLEINSNTFTQVTPQPSSPALSTQEAGASPLPPVPGVTSKENTDET
jgi:hypothetical protein